jgi:hypothetical protein
MSAARLIREIEEHGATLQLVGQDIKARGASKVPHELVERLRERKPAVLEFLKACDLSTNPRVHRRRKPTDPKERRTTPEESEAWASYDRLVIATMARIGASLDG